MMSLSRIETLIRQLQGNLGGRIITGAIGGTGAAARGSGYTSSRTGVGVYAVTFTTAYGAAPEVFIQATTSGSVRVATVAASSTTGFTIEMRNDVATLSDASFSFLAIG